MQPNNLVTAHRCWRIKGDRWPEADTTQMTVTVPDVTGPTQCGLVKREDRTPRMKFTCGRGDESVGGMVTCVSS